MVSCPMPATYGAEREGTVPRMSITRGTDIMAKSKQFRFKGRCVDFLT